MKQLLFLLALLLPDQFSANPVQGRDVGPHKLEDFRGVPAVAAIAFDVHHAPQLVSGLPPQAFANTGAPGDRQGVGGASPLR